MDLIQLLNPKMRVVENILHEFIVFILNNNINKVGFPNAIYRYIYINIAFGDVNTEPIDDLRMVYWVYHIASLTELNGRPGRRLAEQGRRCQQGLPPLHPGVLT